MMANVFDLLSNPIVLLIVGAVVAFALYQKFAPSIKVRVPGKTITLDTVLAKLLGPRRHQVCSRRKYSHQAIILGDQPFPLPGIWMMGTIVSVTVVDAVPEAVIQRGPPDKGKQG